MSHIIDFFEFKVGTKEQDMKRGIAGHIAYEHDDGINPERGISWYETGEDCFNGIVWEKKVFANYDEAQEYLNMQEGFYVQRAVQYKKGKVSKTTQTAREKAYNAWVAMRKMIKDTNVFNIKSAYLGCKSCGSKISTQAMMKRGGYYCPVCNADLRSETMLKTVARKQAKYDELDKKAKELEKKDNEKGELYWVIRTEYHE